MKKLIVKLVPPSGDKGYSFQTMHASAEQMETLIGLMSDPVVIKARPFLQGQDDSSGWIMIEFWVPDRTRVLEASAILAQLVGACLVEGEITMEDVRGTER